MPSKKTPHPFRALPLAALVATTLLVQPATAQTDDAAPFYAGVSLGASHVSNVYRQAAAPNSDTVTSSGLLAGTNQRLGRQHLVVDGSLQNNRYSGNRDLNNRSYSLRGALNWETVGNLSGVLSAKSDRTLADFNMGGVDPLLTKKNTERNDEYQATARLGVATRYTLETGWSNRRRSFTAAEYDRFAYRQNTGWLGLFATPAGNLRLGLVGRHTKGTNPRYLTGDTQNPVAPNDYTRNDIDFTTNWTLGGHSSLNTRFSRSKTKNGLAGLSDFSGTTGSLGWNWQPTGKLQFNLQYARDTGQESSFRVSDLNRVYTSWQFGSSYALTAKITASARATGSRSRRSSDTSNIAFYGAAESTRSYNTGLRWTISRGFSLSCQYDRVARDSNEPLYAYTASSYGCTGQAILY